MDSLENEENKNTASYETGSPLCLFYFSHPFSIASHDKIKSFPEPFANFPDSAIAVNAASNIGTTYIPNENIFIDTPISNEKSVSSKRTFILNETSLTKEKAPSKATSTKQSVSLKETFSVKKTSSQNDTNPSKNPVFDENVTVATTRSQKQRSTYTASGTLAAERKNRRFGKKRSAWTLVKYLTERIRLQSRRNKLPCLEDVVNTLQAAWLQDNDLVKCSSTIAPEQSSNLDAAFPMASSHDVCKDRLPSGFPSPVLLRRRLSAPETIMRKHKLSQQRSDSTESDSTQLSSNSPHRTNNNNIFWNRTSATGSESNLSLRKSYKRDPDLMRKSTLLRRMWSREFTGSISRIYNNEEIFPKKHSMTIKSQSRSPVRSIRSSPEHINKERADGKFSPERRINGDVGTVGLMKTKWDEMNSYSSYASDVISRVSSTSESNKSILESSSTDIKVSSICTTTSTENESFSSTRTTTETSGSHLDDNLDSAYTNTQTYSTFSSSKSNSENNNNVNNVDSGPTESKQTLNANHEVIQGTNYSENHEKNQSDNMAYTQPLPDLNTNNNTMPDGHRSNDFKWNNQRLETSDAVPKIEEQTADLNIVNLSAATLNIIINSSPEVCENIASAKSVIEQSVKKPESFYLKRKEDVPISAEHSRLIKYMISNVGAGSQYSKPTEAPQLVVPRYSALPRSLSMEVNTSSADSTDKESDTASLVDSLDDPNSPRQSALTPRIKYDDKPVRGDLSALLPDNSSSNKETPRSKTQKGSAFYVSIVQDQSPEEVKTVAEHLPERVRNRLSKRQQIMEQKKLSAKKTDNQNLDSNGNQDKLEVTKIVENNEISEATLTNNGTLKKIRKEKKLKNPLQSLPSYKVNARGELTLNPNATVRIKKNLNRQVKRKYTKHSESSESSSNAVIVRKSVWNNHLQIKSPTAENKNECSVEPAITEIVENPSFDNQNFSNRIEILEIMECVEPVHDKSLPYQRNNLRSKIPVPVQYKMPDVASRQIQAVYHAYDISKTPEYSPKTDQLIANILIDALNKQDICEMKGHEIHRIIHQHQTHEKRPPPMVLSKQQVNRYQQKFDIIPEEKLSSLGSSQEDAIVAIVEDKNSLILENKEIKTLAIIEKEEAKSIEVQTEEPIIKNPAPVVQTVKKTLADAAIQTDLPVDCSADLPIRIPTSYKGKAALAVMKDEDFSTIPKGWITFYMLKKSPGSPDSSTDEGANAEGKNNNLDEKFEGLELRQLRPVKIKRKIGKENVTNLNPVDINEANNNSVKEDETKRSVSLEQTNEALVISKKEHYSTSSESSKSHSPNNEHDGDQKLACPLPVALPSRQGRRQTHRRGRYKTTSQSQNANSSQVPGGWSVTVSGTNTCGQPAPDLEMRLKFPCPQPQSQSDSGLGEEHPRPPRRNFEQQPNDDEFHLPPAKPVTAKKYNVITKKHNNDDLADDSVNSRSFQYLPDLIKNKGHKTAKRRDCSVPVTRGRRRQFSGLDLVSTPAMPPLAPLKMRGFPSSGSELLKPRQTLTSYRRFSLHHSSHLSPHFKTLLPSALSMDNLNTEDIMNLPECFPAILAVTGSAISPESKPRVPTMTEKDLTRNHFSFGQHHA